MPEWQTLPDTALVNNVLDAASCMQVRDWYVESFRDLKAMAPIRDAQDELRFTEMLTQIYQRHAHVVPTMARCADPQCTHFLRMLPSLQDGAALQVHLLRATAPC